MALVVSEEKHRTTRANGQGRVEMMLEFCLGVDNETFAENTLILRYLDSDVDPLAGQLAWFPTLPFVYLASQPRVHHPQCCGGGL